MPFPLRRRVRRTVAVLTTATLAVTTLGLAASSASAADRDKDRRDGGRDRGSLTIPNDAVGSTVNGIRIDGSRDKGAKRDGREPLRLQASARPQTAFQVPFRCGEDWYGSTRSSHSPSVLSVDWNRTDDFDKPVVSSGPGTVTTATRSSSGYGNWVVVDHGSGESTLYAHLNSIAVRVGQKVAPGDMVGRLGTTGNSTGPHLHYEQRRNGSVIHPWFDGKEFRFGTTIVSRNCQESVAPLPSAPYAGDVPVAANVLGGRADDATVWRRDTGVFETRRPDGKIFRRQLGGGKDRPVMGDWSGKGKALPGVFTSSDRTFRLKTSQGLVSFRFGYKGSVPLAGDWDGDGNDEVGVWRSAITRFDLRGPQGGVIRKITFGKAGQLPFVGDWNGDGKTDVGLYDRESRTFTLRYPTGTTKTFVLGARGALPVAGDWDGDGLSEVGAWNPATGGFTKQANFR